MQAWKMMCVYVRQRQNMKYIFVYVHILFLIEESVKAFVEYNFCRLIFANCEL